MLFINVAVCLDVKYDRFGYAIIFLCNSFSGL